MYKLGREAKLYRNAGTYEAPDWQEIGNARDVSANVDAETADNLTTRAYGGWKATVVTLQDAAIEFDMVWDPDDDGFVAIREAFFGRTPIEIAAMSADIETAGSEGLRATMAVTTFRRSEPLTEGITVSVTLKPTYSAHPPEWLVIGEDTLKFSFTETLEAGAGALDLTAIPYGVGTYDGTGKTVTAVAITNNGANGLAISPAAEDGYKWLGAGVEIMVPAGGTVRLTIPDAPTIAANARLLDLVGTGAQTSTWTLTLATPE